MQTAAAATTSWQRAATHVWAGLRTTRSVVPYLGIGLLFPTGASTFSSLPHTAQEAYRLYARLLARPGFAQLLAAVEREDWLTLPWFLAAIPGDLLRIQNKAAAGRVKLPVSPAPEDGFPYPGYYLNDFHNQKNGHFSHQAAWTYERQISVLFLGTQRLMRQAIIDHLPVGRDLRVLDVACGTGAWIPQARRQGRLHPITAIDLSPAYLAYARNMQRLGLRKDTTFLQMNAEALDPAFGGQFDVVTSIWLLHELPVAATERAVAEMARALKPGGRLLLLDAVQRQDLLHLPEDRLAESDRIQRFFAKRFNEPYFLAYQKLDVDALLRWHGLVLETSELWFRSKLWVAKKAIV
jgi:ubiquinone/menaquinone biosynthesis C-methylase UbiE